MSDGPDSWAIDRGVGPPWREQPTVRQIGHTMEGLRIESQWGTVWAEIDQNNMLWLSASLGNGPAGLDREQADALGKWLVRAAVRRADYHRVDPGEAE